MVQMTRRQFLFGGGAAMFLAACKKSTNKSDDSNKPSGAMDEFQALTVSSDLYVTDTPQRFAFAWAMGSEFVGGPSATIQVSDPDDKETTDEASQYKGEGLDEGRGIYVTNLKLDKAGVWQSNIEVDGNKFTLPFEVKENSSTVKIGGQAPDAPSPTVSNTLGVDPICTRDPECSLHTTSVNELIKNGRPTVVLFATPARCQSKYCGPVLDNLLNVLPDYQDKIDATHVEIYKNNQTNALIDTVNSWGLVSEPWLYAVDQTGKIVTRLDGAFDESEIKAAFDQLT